MTDAEDPAAPAPSPEEEAPEAAAEEPASENEPTAELPKSILGGKEFKPGDEVVLEVVTLTENSVVVKYASGEDEPDEGDAGYGGPPAEAPGPGGPMGGYME